MHAETLVIGTRGSQLARWQANWAKTKLERYHPGLNVEIRIITTRGDRVQDVALPKLGEEGKGLFTKELEDEMLAGQIDIAVHSLKDLPTEMTPGLHIAAITEREDVRDALVAGPGISSLANLTAGARVGTSSQRRQ
ncbi:MAG TPA: hydroxymethylbilane synthase, partial [Blastocatellia bacterium]